MNEDLTVKQKRALERLKEQAIPAPAPLQPQSLVLPPLEYRVGIWLWQFGVPAFFLLFLSVFPWIQVPEVWSGKMDLKSGSVIQLLTQGSQTVNLPRGQGKAILEGPATLEFQRLRRHLLSGRMSGELQLMEGGLFLRAKSAIPKEILIRTPLVVVRVTGTQLFVGHDPEGGSRVLVIEGKVAVKRDIDAAWKPLEAGKKLVVHPDGTFTLQKILGPSSFVRPEQAVQAPADAQLPADDDSAVWWRLLWHEE